MTLSVVVQPLVLLNRTPKLEQNRTKLEQKQNKKYDFSMYFGRYVYPFLLQQVTCDKKRDNFNDTEMHMPHYTLLHCILHLLEILDSRWKKFATGNDANLVFFTDL